MTVPASTTTIRIEPADSPNDQALIAALDADIISRYPGDTPNGIDAAGFEAAGGVFVVCYIVDEAAACGAIRPLGDRAEVKRMFVSPAFRGRGLARKVLRHLETLAAQRGYTHAILETGLKQPEAIGLYTSEGWERCPAYGKYSDETSACFEKRLPPA